MVQSGGKLERMAIVHTNSLPAAQDLNSRLSAFAPAEVFIVEATPAIGVHIGPGCLAVAFVSAQ
jgi:fatty acid-binding protein DegV